MPAAAVAGRKRELRARLLAARRALPARVRAEAAGRVQAAVTALAAARASQSVAGYAPMPGEPGGADLPSVLAGGLGPAGRLLLPVLREDRDLDWTVYRTGQRLDPESIIDASLLVVPAVAVDRWGVRLGRGGGSYDRVLARLAPGTEVVALLHDGELLDEPLPCEPHDRRVTAVITPTDGLIAMADLGPAPSERTPPTGPLAGGPAATR